MPGPPVSTTRLSNATQCASRVRLPQPDMQFTQLRFINRIRRMRQQTLGALRFGERDNVAYRFSTCHHCNDTVEPERNTAVRGRAILQRLQEKSEFRLGLFSRD